MDFFNGIILLYTSRLKEMYSDPESFSSRARFGNHSGIKINLLSRAQLKTTLKKLLDLVNDSYTLNLLNHEFYVDLEDYLIAFLFKSDVYKLKMIELVRKIVKKRWIVEMEQSKNRSKSPSEIPEMETILHQVSNKVGNKQMISFIFGQIVEHIKDLGVCIFASNNPFNNARHGLFSLSDL